jgi:hypothetical protein
MGCVLYTYTPYIPRQSIHTLAEHSIRSNEVSIQQQRVIVYKTVGLSDAELKKFETEDQYETILYCRIVAITLRLSLL